MYIIYTYIVFLFVTFFRITHSINKTSKACQRRILYIMKNPQTERSVRLCLEEIRWLPAINKNFGPAYLKAFREISADHEDFTNRVSININVVLVLIDLTDF